jgi:hypothetical protein
MTAQQHHEVQPAIATGIATVADVVETTDPIGPITLPKRTKVGARALALAGGIGLSTLAIAAVSNEVASTWPTI